MYIPVMVRRGSDISISPSTLCLLTGKDGEDLIARANNTPFGLASAVWTRDINKAHNTAKRLKAGTVWVNCYNIFDAALPFGGYKESGWGREMGPEVFELYTQTKSIVIKTK
jgi:phenylacetaldehyde dehydrogenase